MKRPMGFLYNRHEPRLALRLGPFKLYVVNENIERGVMGTMYGECRYCQGWELVQWPSATR